MKNLAVWNVSVKEYPNFSENKFVASHSHDVENGAELYVCSDNLHMLCFDEAGVLKWSKDLSFKSQLPNNVVDVTFLTVPSTVCVGFGGGELFTLSDLGRDVNLIGYYETGILAMQWCPDQELLAIVTKDMKAILMSCNFCPIQETDLLAEEFGEKQFITVGWGKKETQFHGREGKNARVKAEVSAVPTFLTSSTDPQADNSVKITWRGDGNYYAVGFTQDCIRRFKVFDKDGHLQYTSEKQQGLESNICWRPSGNLIATTQRLPNKYVVAFFEKNGLKHGEFDIPVNSTTIVEDLLWSNDSEILTLQCKDTADNTQKLLLFTMSNYHWYLKQTLAFNKEQNVSQILWDNDFDVVNNKKLHIILSCGKHYVYTWIWNVDHSRGTSDEDDAVVAVINGKKILLTGIRQTVVPPPMAAFEIELESFANSIHFAPRENNSTNSFFVVTTDNKVVFFEQTQKNPLKYEVTNRIQLDEYDFPFQYYNLHWLTPDIILGVSVDGNSYSLTEFQFESDRIVKNNKESLPAEVVRIEPHPRNPLDAFLQVSSGDLLQYTVGGHITPCDVSFGAACPKFNVISIENDLHFIGLTHKSHLYFDDALIMNVVSSFFVHTDFVLITTLQHFLLCIELSKLGVNVIRDIPKDCSPYIYMRKIERGAKLVIAVPNETRTVFQMPRGNLETIQPRPLSLKIIGKYLNGVKYYEAFDLMRKQRINLNLIYDHDPEKFIANINVFLDSIQNNSWLSLFVSDLENIDVTRTMYGSSYAERKEEMPADIGDKVRKVCELVRSSLKSRSDTDQRILPLLTSFVKTNTQEDLESALALIKELKKREENGTKLPVGSDEALKYLLYMVEVNKLFDIALGVYDFDLVLLVANKSQKDPKEYIPMLNELNQMQENYKRFSINKHLKRFDRAVKCLIACGPEKHEELKTFVKFHSLYRQALNNLNSDQDIYKEISEDFGQHLWLMKHYKEAGIVYRRGGHIDKAIDCFKEALEWEWAIALAEGWSKERFLELCMELVNVLKNENRHKEALTILEKHIDDKEIAIRYSIEAGLYKTSIRLCYQHKREDLNETLLLPALLEEYKNLQELVETNYATFVRYRDRLKVVREIKAKAPVEVEDSYENRDSDLYSDAGSTVASSSRGSTRSYRSSKNRRKHERKVASLKEGSQYEDLALLRALHTLVTSSSGLRGAAKQLTAALSWFGNEKEAFVLQTSLVKLLQEQADSFKEIWSDKFTIEATNAAVAAAQDAQEGGPAVIRGLATLEPQLRIPPIIQNIDWTLHGLF